MVWTLLLARDDDDDDIIDNGGCTVLTPITLDDIYSIDLTINDDDNDDVGPIIIALTMDCMTFIVTLSSNHIIDRNDDDPSTILKPITLDNVYSIGLTLTTMMTMTLVL